MKKSNDSLFSACINNNKSGVIDAIERKLADVNSRSTDPKYNGATPVMVAAGLAHEEIVDLLLQEENIDITLRQGPSNYWYEIQSGRNQQAGSTIKDGNALDIVLLTGSAPVVKKLLLHAALYLNEKQQAELLGNMPEKNILLYVVKVYPRHMKELVEQIAARNDKALFRRLMNQLLSANGVTPEIINKYLQLFAATTNLKADAKQFKSTHDQLLAMQFYTHLTWFKNKLQEFYGSEQKKITQEFVDNLNQAQTTYLLTYDKIQFQCQVSASIKAVLPADRVKVALVNFIKSCLAMYDNQVAFLKMVHDTSPEHFNDIYQWLLSSEATTPDKGHVHQVHLKLTAMKFDQHLTNFRNLPQSQDSFNFVKDLERAKTEYILTGNLGQFTNKVSTIVKLASPALTHQSLWSSAIALLLEALSYILPISENQIAFFRPQNVAKHLEELKAEITASTVGGDKQENWTLDTAHC